MIGSESDYQEALRWVEKAREIAPDCPLVLWDYAGTLDMLGREREGPMGKRRPELREEYGAHS